MIHYSLFFGLLLTFHYKNNAVIHKSLYPIQTLTKEAPLSNNQYTLVCKEQAIDMCYISNFNGVHININLFDHNYLTRYHSNPLMG